MTTTPSSAAAHRPAAADVLDRLAARGETLGCAESLTGGLLTARLVDVPGASAVVRGGVVSYAPDLKTQLLGVDAGLLEQHGPVDFEVAAEMARGACATLGADWGVATTGVAGPDSADGTPVGVAYVGVVRPGGRTRVRKVVASGDRAEIRETVVGEALGLLGELLSGKS